MGNSLLVLCDRSLILCYTSGYINNGVKRMKLISKCRHSLNLCEISFVAFPWP